MLTGSNNSEILTIKEPSVNLDEIVTSNYKTPNKEVADKSKYMGNYSPFVKINGYQIDNKSLVKFRINCTGFIPTVSLSFKDITKQFQNDFPKDGDLIEIYIRSRNNDKVRKIRVNFDIINVKGVTGRVVNSYTLNGIMRIPNMFSEQQIGLTNNTSFNHLLELCDLTNLGFASNDTNTNDSMPRFNSNNTIKDFMNKITETSYKNDESFYTSYVDIYYYLCMVNVNNLFSLDETLQDGEADLISALTQDKSNINEGTSGDNGKILLSNHSKYDNTTNYIQSYKMFNNSGDIWMKNGYKRYCQYLDIDEYDFKSFFVDPLTTKGSENDYIILKGKANDNYYEFQNKFTYLGRQISTNNEGNLHPNYHFAKILNYQNNQEINKMGLTVVLQDISSSINRYRRIPVAIYEKNGNLVNNASMRNGDLESDNTENISQNDYNRTENDIANNFISGFYVVRDYVINWDDRIGFTQEVNLIRREWSLPYSASIVKNK